MRSIVPSYSAFKEAVQAVSLLESWKNVMTSSLSVLLLHFTQIIRGTRKVFQHLRPVIYRPHDIVSVPFHIFQILRRMPAALKNLFSPSLFPPLALSGKMWLYLVTTTASIDMKESNDGIKEVVQYAWKRDDLWPNSFVEGIIPCWC